MSPREDAAARAVCPRTRTGRALAALATLAAVVLAGWAGLVAAARPAAAAGWNAGALEFQPAAATAMSVDGVGTYAGAVEVVPSPGGLGVVNDVGFETYLQGVSEVPPTWPEAALQAQAVAARTYALWDVLAHPRGSWTALGAQICASDACQVYRGLQRQAEPGDAAWQQAVQSTAGQVLLYQGQVIEAEYGSSDGGQTRSGGVPWLPSVIDPDDAASPLHHWQWSAPLSAFQGPLGVPRGWALTALSGDGNGVQATLRSTGGRVVTRQVSGRGFHDALNSAMAAPAGLPLALPSFSFSVATAGADALVGGGGFGNGVGLSQYGALGKAERGMSAAGILAAYYGGLTPTALGPGQEPDDIRVALASRMSSVTIRSNGPLRLTDGSGHVLATLGAGAWRLTGAGPVHADTIAGGQRVSAQSVNGPSFAAASPPLAAKAASAATTPTAGAAARPWQAFAGLNAAANGQERRRHVIMLVAALMAVGNVLALNAARRRRARARYVV